MKNLNFFWGSVATLCLMAGCADEWVVNSADIQNGEKGFVIHADNGADADTRLAFGEDGLSLQWEDGDQLVLVSVDDKVAPIYLTTTLDKPATKATFVANSEAPAGTYYVFNVPDNFAGDETLGETRSTAPQRFEDWIYSNVANEKFNVIGSYYRLQNLSTLSKSVRMYAGPIEIADGQTSLNINLKHGFAMVKFDITGLDKVMADHLYQDINIGMLSSQKPLPNIARLDGMGEIARSSAKLLIGSIDDSQEDVRDKGAFILPINLSDQDIYFYIHVRIYDDISGLYISDIVYEIKKGGINIKSGTCYTVHLDMSEANKIEIANGQIFTTDQMRLLAYNCHNAVYTIMQDLDFTGITYFPLSANLGSLEGNNHTISNLTIDYPYDGSGLFCYAEGFSISNLHLKNVTVNGANYVGAFCGKVNSIDLRNCTLSGNNRIIGTGDYVGGLVGGQHDSYINLYACSVNKETIVQGKNFVGGIAGQTNEATNCTSAATVNGANSVGGIAGLISRGLFTNCASSSVVTATGDYVGGLIGNGTLFDQPSGTINAIRCYTTGSVKGQNYVGGIIGSGIHDGRNNLFKECYSISAVSGISYVGGIAGADCSVFNSYFIGSVTGTDPATTAGITGYISRYEQAPTQAYCYSAGMISSGYGILASYERNEAFENDGIYKLVSNCLTTSPHLSSVDMEDDEAYTNIVSIQDYIDVINGDLAYSATNIWPDYSFDCPKLRWQTTISTGTGDEGTDAPEFDEEDW